MEKDSMLIAVFVLTAGLKRANRNMNLRSDTHHPAFRVYADGSFPMAC